MRLRVQLCPDCYRAVERAPLLHVRRILLACETCRPAALELGKGKARNALELSALAEATKAASAHRPTDILEVLQKVRRRQRGR